jgi:hypothetical protein
MKIRWSIMAAAAAVVLGSTGALALPAVAGAHSATTTITFKAVAYNNFSFDDTVIYHQIDFGSTGAKIGFDDLYSVEQTCCTVTADVAFAITGGLLYASFATNGSPTFSGTVTGGTGAFNGVTGTISGRLINNPTLTKIRFTITYS